LIQENFVEVVVTQDSDLIVFNCQKVGFMLIILTTSFFRSFSSLRHMENARFLTVQSSKAALVDHFATISTLMFFDGSAFCPVATIWTEAYLELV
jgi:hypothetical protein